MAGENTTSHIQHAVRELEPYVIEQRRRFHAHPELSLQEFWTTDAIAAEKGIALFDVATEVVRRRGNASDQFLEIVSLLDLDGILRRIPGCEAVVTTGQKATDALLSLTGAAPPPMGGHSSFPREGCDIRLYRMPSSSRAYPKPLEEKAGVYRKMFQELKML